MQKQLESLAISASDLIKTISKPLRRDLQRKVVAFKSNFLVEIQEFYGKICTSQTFRPRHDSKNPRAYLNHHFLDDLPEVRQSEIVMAAFNSLKWRHKML